MRAKVLTALAVLATVCSTQAFALPLDLYTLTPCRAVDTRAGEPLASGVTETFQIGGLCGVPGTARALAINVTVVEPTAQGNVKVWPADRPEPATSTINFGMGARANNALATLATDGSGELSVEAFLADSGSVHLIIDVTGYLAGDPLPPCQCPVEGNPLPLIFGISPSSGGAGTTVTISGQSLPQPVQVLFGDPATGNSAPVLASSSASIAAKVPAPPSGFTFSTEPCDSDGDGSFDGTRSVPTPISVNAQSVDGTGCVATLSSAFTLIPSDTACTGGGNPAGPPQGFGRDTRFVEGGSATQCQCPTNGTPLPVILGVSPSTGSIGATVTISGQSFASQVHVLFGDAETGSAAAVLSASPTSISARVPTPPFGFTFSTEPCDGNGDGIPAGSRKAPTPIDVNVRNLDGTGCVTTLGDAFLVNPTDTVCIGDDSTPPAPR